VLGILLLNAPTPLAGSPRTVGRGTPRRAPPWARGLLAPALLASVCVTESSRASDPLNSSNRSNTGAADEPRAYHEFNLLPVGGGTTDIGIGGGYFMGYARITPERAPYDWNVESAGFVTFAPGAGGGFVVPYQDFYLKLTVPRFFESMELEVRPAYSWESTLRYYGMGNASSAALPAGASSKYFEFGRLHPEMDVDLRWRFVDHVVGRTGVRYIQNWFQVAGDSKLARDQATGSADVKSLLGSTAPTGVALFNYGIQFDNRDNNVSSHQGTFDSFDLQLSPGGVSWLPYRYMEATADLRFFVPIWKPRMTLAGRVVGDVLYGTPPFYALAVFEDTYAIGGLNGVRGVPGQRYYGKVKALGNLEVRTELASFHALGKAMVFGVVGFLDGGRVWADTSLRPQLDGSGIGLKYGAGGGLRLQSGAALVLRADVAWSPDATPVGAYVAAGQMF
jgi:surface antigen Omp85-like protein